MTFAPDWDDHFWRRAHPEALSGCWLWHAEVNDKGYGRYTIRGDRHPAHRVSYERAIGPIPRGLHVLHRCDVRGCVNPAHLFLGTQHDNIRDMVAKGRQSRGENHPAAKLTAQRVSEARSRCDAGETAAGIAAEYGVCRQTMARAIRRDRCRSKVPTASSRPCSETDATAPPTYAETSPESEQGAPMPAAPTPVLASPKTPTAPRANHPWRALARPSARRDPSMRDAGGNRK